MNGAVSVSVLYSLCEGAWRGNLGSWGKASSASGAARPAGPTLGRGLVKFPNGSIACRFFQTNSCTDQKAAHCVRASGIHKHLCTAMKQDGTMCMSRHSRMDHK